MIFMCWTTAGLPMCRMRSSGFSRGSFRKWNFSARAGNVEKSVLPADGILFAGGGCRRNYTEENKNYFCKSYQEFFAYAISRLEWLAARL